MTTRIAIVDNEKCQSKKCQRECMKSCPVNAIGKECITVDVKAKIDEASCNGCNICTKKCPFGAIEIIHVPNEHNKDVIYRYSSNSFKLHNLPMMRKGKIIGLVGQNGVGKTTTIQILSGNIRPNFGKFQNEENNEQILKRFRGSEMQNYISLLLQNKIRVSLKPQMISECKFNDERKLQDEIMQQLNILHLRDRDQKTLSGGELQRFAICSTLITDADVYIFDEPTSFLDITQRIQIANIIKKYTEDKYVLVIDHDLSILDYLTDQIHIIYGQSSVYGICSMPFSTSDGINNYLTGYIASNKLRIRENQLNFKLKDFLIEKQDSTDIVYESSEITNGEFKLNIKSGSINNPEIVVLLAPNGYGKTTMIKYLTNYFPSISYKPQILNPKFKGTVEELLSSKIGSKMFDSIFVSDVIKPLGVNKLYKKQVLDLSGGELQKCALILCLGKEASVYLIDEPSNYLDSESRIIASKIIRKFVYNNKKSALIVEHDFLMLTYLADKIILFDYGLAHSPVDTYTGINRFLETQQITMRRDKNYRPRINKLNSQKDQQQKSDGIYFYLEPEFIPSFGVEIGVEIDF